jgi:N-acetylglucosamine-6-sulfatase
MNEMRTRHKRSGMSLRTKGFILALLSLWTWQVPIGVQARSRYNVVILMSDDQRWDKVSGTYTPKIWNTLVTGGTRFQNAFVPNALCCPSRVSTLTGDHSHSTGVWNNHGSHGGFEAFDDRHHIGVDFDRAGYRTALIGKYLNGYFGGLDRYVPPGWDTWFATHSGAYYNYGVTTRKGPRRYGDRPRDYITRVLSRRAARFVERSTTSGHPFFLFYSFTAPHNPSIPDPRDTTRFKGVTGSDKFDDDLESAYGVDRAVGELLEELPSHTIVLYMSDNGYLWGERKGLWGRLHRKQWPYNESIRIPFIIKSLDGTYLPAADRDDLVLNIDVRKTLTRAAGVTPATRSEGINLGGHAYAPRFVFPLEHLRNPPRIVPSYCGARKRGWMYVRWQDGSEELYNDPAETHNLVGDEAFAADYVRMREAARRLCKPRPPGYIWDDGA